MSESTGGVRPTTPLDERIVAASIPEPNTGCWLWTGAMVTSGYGLIAVPGRGKVRSNRASWIAFRGPIPPGMHVLHKCDTPACVNPDHLFLGTHADNMADRQAKGRSRAGGDPGMTITFAPGPRKKMSDEQVREARALLESGVRMGLVAKRLGFSDTAIRRRLRETGGAA